jgi:hypothetical protein
MGGSQGAETPGVGLALESVEAGLLELVLDAGPDIRKRPRAPGLGCERSCRRLKFRATGRQMPRSPTVLIVIQECVHQIPNPRWRVAALATFRL